jgi:CBS domain-containing protein
MLIREIMTTDLVTVEAGATLREVTGALLDNGVGSVVVVDDGIPTGLITESDVLRAAHERDTPLSELSTGPLTQEPLVTVEPDASVGLASRRMLDEGVKKLPVVDDLDLVGIVTLTDVVYHLSDLRTEAEGLARRHYDWTR